MFKKYHILAIVSLMSLALENQLKSVNYGAMYNGASDLTPEEQEQRVAQGVSSFAPYHQPHAERKKQSN